MSESAISINLNTLILALLGGLISMVGFLVKKWTNSIEKKLCSIETKKMDATLCMSRHKIIEGQFKHVTEKLDDFKKVNDELRSDIKELVKIVSKLASGGK